MWRIFSYILVAHLISLINVGYGIIPIGVSMRRFFNFPRNQILRATNSGAIKESECTLQQTSFWPKLNYTEISNRADRNFVDTKINQSVTNVYLVPKSSFEEFKRCNISSFSLSILDAMGLGQSLLKVPALVNGGSKLYVIPVLKPISVNDSSVPPFIVENITVLFYDNDALITDGSFSVKNLKVFDSIWTSAIFQSSSPSSNGSDQMGNNSFATTDYNFVMFNHSQLSPAVADALCLSWALSTYK